MIYDQETKIKKEFFQNLILSLVAGVTPILRKNSKKGFFIKFIELLKMILKKNILKDFLKEIKVE